MDNYKICPACQRINSSIASRCHYCGTSLNEPKIKYAVTTKGVQITPPERESLIPGCKNLRQQLPKGSLALIVAGSDKPIIIHNITSVVLGRGDEPPPGVDFVNLSRLGDLVMGISRQHARISYEDEQFWLEDMHSTNGSWLNRKRLVAGVPYPLSINDNIWLGPLKMAVCFATEKSDTLQTAVPAKEITITLQPRNALVLPQQPLSPEFLVNFVAPFLQSLAQVQQAMDRLRERTAVPIYIRTLKEQNMTTVVTLVGAAEIISIYHALITVWRDRYFAKLQAGSIPDNEQIALTTELAFNIGQVVAPSFKETDVNIWAEQILPAVQQLATSQLEIQQVSPSLDTTAFGLDDLNPPA